MKARYYIVQKSNWQGDGWMVVAGPFDSREGAEIKSKNYQYSFIGTFGLDLKSQLHAKVVSRTWLRQHGYPRTREGEHYIVEDIVAHQQDVENGATPV